MKIVLEKTKRDAGNCWESLFKDGRFAPNPWTLDEMRKKLTLQRFQLEVSWHLTLLLFIHNLALLLLLLLDAWFRFFIRFDFWQLRQWWTAIVENRL